MPSIAPFTDFKGLRNFHDTLGCGTTQAISESCMSWHGYEKLLGFGTVPALPGVQAEKFIMGEVAPEQIPELHPSELEPGRENGSGSF